MKDSYYITTPIYYINDRPHLGHAYTTIVADTLARLHVRMGEKTVFVTGTDENAQKTVEAAEKNKEDIVTYTDRLADIWKTTWHILGITNTDFIRTTEKRHQEIVEEIWRRILDKGDIYKGHYEGLYCRGHEAFLKEGDLVDGLCPDHKTRPERISEENYFFRLSKYRDELLNFYDTHRDFVVPQSRFNEVKSFVRGGLEDISVSRETQQWGIPVPNDPKHVVYVWFDALINYISAVGIRGWEKHPADVHAIGKDIIRFHAVIWPAMLLSAGLPLPGRVIANGFFTVDGVKISKSLGNTIDPIELSKTYGVDALRYYLLREIPYGEDGDFSMEKFRERYNGDLANGLGNFAARVLALGEKLEEFETSEIDPQALEKIDLTHAAVKEKMKKFQFHEALVAIWDLIAFGDLYVNYKKPWEKLDRKVVFTLVAILDNIAGLLAPFLPKSAAEITSSIEWTSNTTLKVSRSEPLFPRAEK